MRSPQIVALVRLAAATAARPSSLLALDDPYAAYCLDEACLFLLDRARAGRLPRFPEDGARGDARGDAHETARDNTQDNARDSTRNGARGDARGAARDTAHDAARGTAHDAARGTAYDAARTNGNRRAVEAFAALGMRGADEAKLKLNHTMRSF